MQLCFVVLATALAAASAYPTLYPVSLKTQYHAQDELGQYSYGYSDGLSAKSEAKTFDGVTRGAYSYVDSAGLVQNVNYISDAAGFRVAASNLPLAPVPAPAVLPVAPLPVADTPEVVAAKAAHLNALNEEAAKNAAAPEETPSDSGSEESNDGADESTTTAPEAAAPASSPAEPAAAAPAPAAEAVPAAAPAPAAVPALSFAPAPVLYAPAPAPFVAAPAPIVAAPAPIVAAPAPVLAAPAPVPVAAAPAAVLAAPAPLVAGPVASQYHAQDELGQYSYGYAGGPSAKTELKTFDGITRGGYSYLDANGLIQSANYISDPVNGFRVAASNLPVAPVPVNIPDSPEVAEAKAQHLALAEKAAAEAANSPE